MRLPKKTHRGAEKNGAEEKRRRDKHACHEFPKFDGCCDSGRTVGQGTGLLDRPWPFSHSALALAALPKREVPTRVLFFFWLLLRKSSSSSHAKWQGSTRWKQGRSGSWKGRDDSPATTSPVSEQVPDEHVTTALHTMQDHLEQTTFIFQRRSQKTFSEQSASKKRCDAACEASPCPCTRKTRKGEAPQRAEVRRGVRGRDHLQRRHVADVLEKHVERSLWRARRRTSSRRWSTAKN